MSVKTKATHAATSVVQARRPRPVERLLYFGGAAALGLLVVVMTAVLGWSQAVMVEVGAVAGALYVLIATPLLLGRKS